MNKVPRKKVTDQKPVPGAEKSESATGSISDELDKLVSGFGQLTVQAYEVYAPIVEDIVNNKSRDTEEIEHTLDRMLGFCFDEKMLALFKRLCRHYYYIDPVATSAHVYAYRDMWDEKSLTNDTVKNSVQKLVNSPDTIGRIRATSRKTIPEIQQTPSVESHAGISPQKPVRIRASKREQLQKLKKSSKKLMLDE